MRATAMLSNICDATLYWQFVQETRSALTFADRYRDRQAYKQTDRLGSLHWALALPVALHLISSVPRNDQRHPTVLLQRPSLELISNNINLRRPLDLRSKDGPQDGLNLQIRNTWLPEYLPLPSTYGRRCICHCDDAGPPCVCRTAFGRRLPEHFPLRSKYGCLSISHCCGRHMAAGVLSTVFRRRSFVVQCDAIRYTP